MFITLIMCAGHVHWWWSRRGSKRLLLSTIIRGIVLVLVGRIVVLATIDWRRLAVIVVSGGAGSGTRIPVVGYSTGVSMGIIVDWFLADGHWDGTSTCYFCSFASTHYPHKAERTD